jgi:hypothetical protein
MDYVLSYDLGPPPPFSSEMAPPLSVFLVPICMDQLHSLAGEGAGGLKSYDSRNTLILYIEMLSLRWIV